MQVALSYPFGSRVVADVLSVRADCFRLVVPGRVDGFSIYLHDEDWVTETGHVVRVESIVLGDGNRPFLAHLPKRGRPTRGKTKPAAAHACGY